MNGNKSTYRHGGITTNISTTIKGLWMDKILSGEKTSEYKGNSDFWWKRLTKFIGHRFDKEPVFITFLRGRMSYKYRVKCVLFYPVPKEIDGVVYDCYWEIRLSHSTQGLTPEHDDG